MASGDDEKQLRDRAEAGDVAAMQNLALLLELGVGGEPNYAEAQKWWSLAARNGDGFAMACLSDIAEKGLAGAVDAAEAKRWRDEAHRHGIIDLSARIEEISGDRQSRSLEEILGKKVLIVDDSATVRTVVADRIKKAGFMVVAAADGEAALAMLIKDPSIAMVITDINMPKLDGLGLVRKMKALPDLKSIPVVVLSTENSVALIKQGRDLGLKGWIIKPPKPGAVEQVVEKLMKEAA